MRGILTNILRQAASRVIVYYCLIAVLMIACVRVDNVKMARVNNLQDIASYPAQYLHGQTAFDERMFRLAKKYYQAFVYTVPIFEKTGIIDGPVALSRTYTMLAVCDHYLGRSDEAIGSLKKAIALEPKHFWLNYDLGLIYFVRGEYATASHYLHNSFSLKVNDVHASMQLDYVQYWPKHFADQYREVSLAAFHEVITKSYELSVLAYEHMKNPKMMKDLSATALSTGFSENNGFFDYYAGLSRRSPVVNMERYRLMVNPSVSFMPIGKEKFMVGNYIKAAQGNP